MGISRFVRFTSLTLTISCAWVSLAGAVSIYDVIELSRQGYGDEEIVYIITTTRSVFKLAAEDIPRLKNLGVSETVIRKMLEAVPAEQAGAEMVSAGALNRELTTLSRSDIADSRSVDQIGESALTASENHSHADSSDHSHADSGENSNPASPLASPDRFSVQTVLEEAAGDHTHVYLTLGSVPIFILRAEGRFQSIEDRARAVVSNLEEARRMGEGRFKALRTDGADIVVYQSANLREVPIISVNRDDVYAYDVRSERRVTSSILAYYWTALLDDYWAITFRHRPPVRLVDLHSGDALMLLFDLVNGSAPDEAQSLDSVVQQLPGPIRRHLDRLAASVPDDFDTWPEQVGDQP